MPFLSLKSPMLFGSIAVFLPVLVGHLYVSNMKKLGSNIIMNELTDLKTVSKVGINVIF